MPENNDQDAGAITGMVTTGRGEPLADAVVMLTGESPRHQDIAAMTGNNGNYRFDDLDPGMYTVMVNVEGYDSKTGEVQVRADQVAHLDFSFSGA